MVWGGYPDRLRPAVLLKETTLARLNPLLAAIFPVMFLYNENIDEVDLSAFGSVLGLVLLASAVFSLVVWTIFRDHVRAGFLAAAWILLFFTAGHLFDELWFRSIGNFDFGRYRYMAAIALIFAGVTLYLSVRRPNICSMLTPVISAALGFLVLFNAGSAIAHSIDDPNPGTPVPTGLADFELSGITPDNLPDIYYIILDSYPREDILREAFDFDNSGFLDPLREKGFFIASESRANYLHTSLSLASSLNMAQLTYLTDTLGAGSKDTRILKSLVRNSEVARFAESLGYKIIHLSSKAALIDWLASNSGVDAHVKRPSLGQYPLGKFGRTILEPLVGNDFGFTFFYKTLLGHITVTNRGNSKLGSLGEYVEHWIRANRAATYVENLELLTLIYEEEGPTFTFAHFLPPHSPYLFDANGIVPRGRIEVGRFTERDLFLAQLRWVNETVGEAVRLIQARDGNSSVIIIQGDHGTLSRNTTEAFTQGGVASQGLIEERSAILNAYYLPSTCEPAVLYPSITPVNNFRVVFNSCFGTNLSLLEDQSYWSTVPRPYDFSLIDDLLKAQQTP